ncbi:glycoside hydrolase family protein, partial [Parabacteroides sp. OttesenSCG-928-K15]|nr:glycoside hydrolase family protein [Parabacteroides sp. OttesenSCG-928-K15]
MKTNISLHLLVALFFLFAIPHTTEAITSHDVKETILSDKIQPINEENIFRDLYYYNWCSSIIKGEDGKYHMFYSRWERSKKFSAWLTHSKVAHAVADKPEGPYKYVSTIVDFDKDVYKKGNLITAHNPKIKYFEGKYYLYFTSTTLERDISNEELIETAQAGSSHANWKPLRVNQRTFVASSAHLDKGWKINTEPLLQPSGPITTLVVNPAITQGGDGRYYLIIKGDKPGAIKFERNQAIAISDYPDKGFVIQPKPVIEDWDTEDVSIWFDEKEKRFYAVFHAHTYIGMMTSEDGVNWRKANDYEVMKKSICREYGQPDIIPNRLERPFVFIENKEPCVLSLAVKKEDDAYIVTIPLKESRSFADKWEFIGPAVEEPGYHIWGSSPIMDKEGKVHLFCARWKTEAAFDPGWRFASEIARYVADSPEGPFHFKEVVLTGTGKDTWDKTGVHNPAIHKVGDKYVLLYISNDNASSPPHPGNQKIGMMVSNRIEGPWEKVGKDGLILSPSDNPLHWTYKAKNGVNNPALYQHPKGGYLLYFKSQDAKMGVAFADNIEGPYVMYPMPVTRNNQTIEDGYAFTYKNRICLLTTDNHGIIKNGGGLLWYSDDGVTFDKYEPGFHLFEDYVGKESLKNSRQIYGRIPKFERPQVLLIDEEPAYLYVPSGANK